MCLYKQRLLNEARQQAQAIFAAYERTVGLDHEEALTFMKILVKCEVNAKDWFEEEERSRALLFRQEKNLGSNHPEIDTLKIKS